MNGNVSIIKNNQNISIKSQRRLCSFTLIYGNKGIQECVYLSLIYLRRRTGELLKIYREGYLYVFRKKKHTLST